MEKPVETTSLEAKLARMQVAARVIDSNPVNIECEESDRQVEMAKCDLNQAIAAFALKPVTEDAKVAEPMDDQEVQIVEEVITIEDKDGPLPSSGGDQATGAADVSKDDEMNGAAELSDTEMSGGEEVMKRVDELLADDPEDKPKADLFGQDAWSDVSPPGSSKPEKMQVGASVVVPHHVNPSSTTAGVRNKFRHRNFGNVGYNNWYNYPGNFHDIPYYRGRVANPVIAREQRPRLLWKCKICMKAGFTENLRHTKQDCFTRGLCVNPITGQSLCFICRQPHLARDCPNKNNNNSRR